MVMRMGSQMERNEKDTELLGGGREIRGEIRKESALNGNNT